MLSGEEVPMDDFGKRVVAARGKYGWTRRELARRAQLHEQHLAKVEREQRPRLEADTVKKLAQALGCTSDYLLGLAETPTPPRKRPRPRTAAPVG
jgi:transcriptional regulator with XRE-family HTH domain